MKAAPLEVVGVWGCAVGDQTLGRLGARRGRNAGGGAIKTISCGITKSAEDLARQGGPWRRQRGVSEAGGVVESAVERASSWWGRRGTGRNCKAAGSSCHGTQGGAEGRRGLAAGLVAGAEWRSKAGGAAAEGGPVRTSTGVANGGKRYMFGQRVRISPNAQTRPNSAGIKYVAHRALKPSFLPPRCPHHQPKVSLRSL